MPGLLGQLMLATVATQAALNSLSVLGEVVLGGDGCTVLADNAFLEEQAEKIKTHNKQLMNNRSIKVLLKSYKHTRKAKGKLCVFMRLHLNLNLRSGL